MVVTFLPYASFEDSARVLDYKRLGKQRVEAWQIYRVLQRLHEGEEKVAWGNCPQVWMWYGYEDALLMYIRAVILEWIDRGYQNNMEIPEEREVDYPPWFGWDPLHASHRASLRRKNPKYYEKRLKEFDKRYQEFYDSRGYVWPVSKRTYDPVWSEEQAWFAEL